MTGESVRAIITNPEVMAVTFITGIGLGLLLEGVTVAFAKSQYLPVVFTCTTAIEFSLFCNLMQLNGWSNRVGALQELVWDTVRSFEIISLYLIVLRIRLSKQDAAMENWTLVKRSKRPWTSRQSAPTANWSKLKERFRFKLTHRVPNTLGKLLIQVLH